MAVARFWLGRETGSIGGGPESTEATVPNHSGYPVGSEQVLVPS